MLRRIFFVLGIAAALAAVLFLGLVLEVTSIRYFGPLDPPDRIYDPSQAVQMLKELGLRD